MTANYAYNYNFLSVVESSETGQRLRLATSGGIEKNPYFFQGRLVYPRLSADLLLLVSEVSRRRFYSPQMRLAATVLAADPVVTSGGERLRFEAFSVCCGVYARLDMKPESIDGEWVGRGTTNVDFNSPMISALSQIKETEDIAINVGANQFELERNGEKVVERKVELPEQWMKGFVEVQSYQSQMKPSFEVSGIEAQKFLDSVAEHVLSNKGPSTFVVTAGRGIRLSSRESYNCVPVGAPGRLKVLRKLARHAVSMRLYTDEKGATTWQFLYPDLTLTLALTPDASRGFAGEGRILSQLAGNQGGEALARVRSALQWQARMDAETLAFQLKLNQTEVESALSLLGTRGLVGYDLELGAYYHRELPFNTELIEKTQPRLTNARKLVKDDGVQITRREGGMVEAYVTGDGADHFVCLSSGAGKCTCPWYMQHSGNRGPCRHVLAVQIRLHESDN